jgi:hypothetical protein
MRVDVPVIAFYDAARGLGRPTPVLDVLIDGAYQT